MPLGIEMVEWDMVTRSNELVQFQVEDAVSMFDAIDPSVFLSADDHATKRRHSEYFVRRLRVIVLLDLLEQLSGRDGE